MIDGFLLLNKPVGMSSNQALGKVKRLLNIKKAGHTGSLDPLASGMLPICLGQATKFAHYLLEAPKAYQTTARLGRETTTGDAEGDVITHGSTASIDGRIIETVLQQFRGSISQIPPMYSAIKFQGQPLYRLARRGQTIERQPRQVHISRLQLLDFQPERLVLDIECSKGTYIRSLVTDIGRALGCGAHVERLHRYQVQSFHAHEMIDFDTIAAHINDDLATIVKPIESAVWHWPLVQLSQVEVQLLYYGQTIMLNTVTVADKVRIYGIDDRFLGIGQIDLDGRLRAIRLLR